MCRQLGIAAGWWSDTFVVSELRVRPYISGSRLRHAPSMDAVKLHTSLDDEWLEDAPAACSASSMNSFASLPTAYSRIASPSP